MICSTCGDPRPRGMRACPNGCARLRSVGAWHSLPRPALGSCLGGCGRAVAVVGRFAGWCPVCRADRVQAQRHDVLAAAWTLVGEDGR